MHAKPFSAIRFGGPLIKNRVATPAMAALVEVGGRAGSDDVIPSETCGVIDGAGAYPVCQTDSGDTDICRELDPLMAVVQR